MHARPARMLGGYHRTLRSQAVPESKNLSRLYHVPVEKLPGYR